MITNIIKRWRGQIPWGHRPNPDDPNTLLQDTDALDLLPQAFDFLDRDFTFRAVVDWLMAQSGQSIGLATLFRLYKRRLAKFPRLARMSTVNDHG